MALTTVRAMQKSHRRHDYHSNSEVPGAIRRRWRPAWRCIHHAGVFPHPGETGHILPDLKRQGRDRRARRFRCKNVPDRPAVGPYHTMLEIPMKERKCSAGILSSRADNVWPHPCAGKGPLVVRPRRKKTQGRVFAPCARWAGCGMIPRITHTGKEVTKEFVDHEPDRHRRDPQTV